MKKNLLVLSSLVLLGSSSLALAADNSWFVGAEFGGMHMKKKANGDKKNVNPLYESIKVGKYFDYGRIYGNFDLQNKKKDLSSYSFGLGYDYIFDVDFPFAPFVGVNAGYTKAKFHDENRARKPDGFYYGAGLGAIYTIDENLEFEAGARYMGASVDDKDGGIKNEVTSFAQYYIGLNYRF